MYCQKKHFFTSPFKLIICFILVGVSELISVKEEEVSGKAEEEYIEDPLGSIYEEGG